MSESFCFLLQLVSNAAGLAMSVYMMIVPLEWLGLDCVRVSSGLGEGD